MALGLDGSLGYAVESTPGTFVTPTDFFEFTTPLSLRKIQEKNTPKGIRAGRGTEAPMINGRHWVEGTSTHELVAENTGILLRAAVKGTPVTTGAGPYVHTFAYSNTRAALSAQEGLPSTSAVHPMSFAGMRVSNWTMRVNPQDVFPTLSFDWLGMSVDTDGTPSLTTPTFPTFSRFSYLHGALTVAGSALCIDGFEISCNLGMTNEPRICAADAGGPNIFQNAKAQFTGTLTTDLVDLTLLNYYLTNSEQALVFTLDAGASAKLVMTLNVQFTGDFPTITSEGRTKQVLPFRGVSSSSDAAVFTAVLTNSDSTA